MINVKIKISGDKEEIAKLRGLKNKLENFSVAMQVIGKEGASYFGGQAFASQGGVFGEPWKRLSPVYQARKTKAYPGRGILVKTGDMQRSFVYRASTNSVTITNSAPQFKYHQSSEPRSKMPLRRMIGVNQDIKTIVKKAIEADVKLKIASS